MAKTSKTTAQPTDKLDGLSYEDAIEKLEGIVASMENDTLPMEQLLSLHEEGVALHRFCQEKLKKAEQRIQQLEAQEDGSLTLKPLTLESDSE